MSVFVKFTFLTGKCPHALTFVLRNFQSRNSEGFQTVEVLCHQNFPDLNPYRAAVDAPDRAQIDSRAAVGEESGREL
jgi:hypothetical protein